MERAFVDTSAWIAFVDPRDADHRRVKVALGSWGARLVTTNFILDETITLCRIESGHDVALRVARRLMDGKSVQVVRATPEDEAAALDLFRDRPDKTYSFTDCTSFVIMRRLGIQTAISLDADFRREGFGTVP